MVTSLILLITFSVLENVSLGRKYKIETVAWKVKLLVCVTHTDTKLLFVTYDSWKNTFKLPLRYRFLVTVPLNL